MIRVLQVFGRMDRGGAEAMIMNLYRNVDRSIIQFDFVVHTEDRCAYDSEIEELGGRIYRVPRFNGRNFVVYVKKWNQLLDAHKEWRIIHGHMRSTASIYLSIAKKKGIYTIAHSHNTSAENGIRGIAKTVLQSPLRYAANYYFACSSEAGEWLFGKKICNGSNYSVLKNSINSKQFAFSEFIRLDTRKKLGIEGKLVVGNISRFHPQKNHLFLLDVFNQIHQNNKESILLLIGDGDERCKIEKKVQDLQLSDCVFFLGVRSDVDELLQAVDILVFPSLYEGLPVSIIEAQAAGVPCLLSDTISNECKITSNVEFFSLNESSSRWADKAVALARNGHVKTQRDVVEHGYDVKENSQWLMTFYQNTISKKV